MRAEDFEVPVLIVILRLLRRANPWVCVVAVCMCWTGLRYVDLQYLSIYREYGIHIRRFADRHISDEGDQSNRMLLFTTSDVNVTQPELTSSAAMVLFSMCRVESVMGPSTDTEVAVVLRTVTAKGMLGDAITVMAGTFLQLSTRRKENVSLMTMEPA